MRTATDRRRAFLLAAGATALAARVVVAAPAAALRQKAAPPQSPHLVAAWDTPAGSHVGIVAVAGEARLSARIAASLAVPTRAHAVARAADGSVLVVARRPGDWLLRLRPAARGERVHAERWRWIEPDRVFNGHAIATPDGRHVLTTETDQDTGLGLVGVRDAVTLDKVDEWPTQGRDPHELLWFERQGRAHVAVANGGIATLAETGRVKHDLPAMDPSLVLLDAATGACAGQWRLADARLGIRHLAQRDGTIAIALQAEHDDPAARASAAVLALFDGRGLRAMPAPRPLAGYGGSVATTAEGFVVSCPRAGGAAHYDARGGWRGFTALPQACPLAVVGDDLYIGGGPTVMRRDGDAQVEARIARDVALDNHWVALPDA